jgi:ketosteroid isomerase-like protein
MKRLSLLLATALAGCTAMTATPPSRDAPASLAAAETAFAAQSMREGMRAAFLAWLAPDATIFRDGPVNGPALIASRPQPPIDLAWRPVFVEVAASGEMGLSTGPSTITSRTDPAAPPRHGQFVSVWKREPGGPWRVQVDLGISHPGAALADEPLEARTVPSPGKGSAAGSLAQAESSFANLAAGSGDASAYAAFAAADARLYREAHPPFLGRTAILASPAAGAGRTAWSLDAHETSLAGDLGYATGRYGPPGGATAGHFVRVWRREPEGWRIAADVVNALPAR